MLTAASYTIAKIWKQPKYLRNEWIKKMWYIHTHTHTHTHTQMHARTMEYYSAKKKNEILPFAVTWMSLEGINLSEINQTKKILYDFTFMRGLKSKTNEETNKT